MAQEYPLFICSMISSFNDCKLLKNNSQHKIVPLIVNRIKINHSISSGELDLIMMIGYTNQVRRCNICQYTTARVKNMISTEFRIRRQQDILYRISTLIIPDVV